jgi:signal-transduction protein with cAMP-binding, CBS, and nucleotidyltransferase domain
MVRIQDVLCGRNLYSVQINQPVADVARRMADLRVGAILVLDENELRGVFSERDLMTRIVVERRDPESTPVNAVMTTDLATIQDTATIEEALDRMHLHNCRHLPVLCGRQVAGFLSMRDLMRFELDRKEEELLHLKAYVHGA